MANKMAMVATSEREKNKQAWPAYTPFVRSIAVYPLRWPKVPHYYEYDDNGKISY